MKTNKNKIKIIIILVLMLFATGCTRQLVDENKKPIKNEATGQTLTANIICQPTDKNTIKAYKKGKVKIEKLPKCEDFKFTDTEYEGLWTNLFVKPLAFILINIGKLVNSYTLSLIIITIIIRLLVFPLSMKMVKQSQVMKEMQPEMMRIQKKYQGKTDQESMMKQNTEMMALYKKYNVNPASGCIFSFIQLPLFIGFFEAIQRTPAIFEENFFSLQLGTTPNVGIMTSHFYAYLILVLLIAGTTYFSMKMTQIDMDSNPTMKMMPIMMTVMILITGLFMPSGLGIYWVTSNIFTMFQNLLVQRSKKDARA